jgi:TRAP-type uncharacterized transport system substrate-binding protein
MVDQKPRDQRNRWRPVRFLNYFIYVGVLAAVAVAIAQAIPPSGITIGTGPVGGSYWETARLYQQILERHGVTVRLQPFPNSLDIVNHVEAEGDPVSIGFTAQAIDPAAYPDTRSLGAIQLQPLFIFASTGLGIMTTPDGLRGHRVVMPPARSATSQAALHLLASYDVTPANTAVSFLPIAQAVAALKAGSFDAGLFMLDPQDGFITDLIADPGLRLISLRDALPLSRLDPFLRPVVLPHGIYDLEHDVPPQDVQMLAATVNVVARRDVSPAILYLLLSAMSDVHHGSSLINNAGVFPNLVDISLPADPLASDYEKNGIPWIYRYLPRWLAALVDSYLVIGLLLVAAAELWSSVVYLTELVDFLFTHFWLRVLLRIESRVRRGHKLDAIHLKLVEIAEGALFRTDRRRRSEELIGRIRARDR